MYILIQGDKVILWDLIFWMFLQFVLLHEIKAVHVAISCHM